MKNTLTTILSLLILVAPAAFAQQAGKTGERRALAEEYKDRALEHVPAFLRAQARVDMLSRVTTQSWVDTDWENNSQTRYTYDGGVQTEVLRLHWEDGDWVNSARTTNTYSGGLLTVQLEEHWINGAWEPIYRILNEYDGDDLSETISQGWEAGDWVNTDRSRITVESGGFSWEGDVWENDDWVLDERATVEEEGDDVVAILEDWTGTEWVNDDRTVYVGITIPELFEFFTDLAEDLETFIGYAFTFRIPDYIVQDWIESEWVNEIRQTTDYDDQDRPITITMDEWIDEEWVGVDRQVRSYENGELVSTDLQAFDEDEWMTYLTESYTYYDNGLLETILQQFDFGAGVINNTLITLEWTSTSTASEKDDLPTSFTLEPVYPNPFNPAATVTYHLESSADVTVSVYDVLGRHVATLASGVHAAGRHEVTFDATDQPSGLYIVRLEAPSHRQSQTVSLIR